VGSVNVGVRFHPASRPSSRSAVLAPGELVRLAVAAERAGADAVLVDGARDTDVPVDPFVLLGALAAVTSRVVLGCVAIGLDDRHPAILAKTVAALDVCSAGRALVCLRPGAPSRGAGLDELAEALDVVRLMLGTPAASWAGRHFAIAGAWNEPRVPRATPTPLAVLVAAPGLAAPGVAPRPGELAELARHHADCCFVEVAGGDSVALDEVSRAVGQDEMPLVALVDTEPGAAPDEVASTVRQLRGAPCHGVVVDWREPPEPERLVEVVSAVRAAVEAPG
jgi:alkanesulfonate monooxygenase SsuD/methylene tetrahydromethanopterin reductase-like flavin-dependent oxidoreductase (luciferase family)